MAMQEEDQRRSAADALGQLPSRSDDVGSEAAVKQAYNDWQDTKPSLFSRQTLTGGARERQAEAAYSKALQASYGRVKFGGNPGATAPSTPAPSTPQYATLASVEGTKKPGAVDMLMGTTQSDDVAAVPSSGGSDSGNQPYAPGQPRPDLGYGPIGDRTKLTNQQAAIMNPAGRITVTRNANGTTEFSGNDVRGQVSYNDASGKTLPGGGLNGKSFSSFEVAPAGSSVATGPNGSYAFSSGSNQQAGNARERLLAIGERSPVGMTVEAAQKAGLVGERVGYNPAYDQRINGVRVRPGFSQSGDFGDVQIPAGMSGAQAAQYASEVQAARDNANSAAAMANADNPYAWMKDLRDPRNLALRNASVGSTIFRNKGEEMMANKARQARIAGVQAAITGQMKGAQEADTARYQSDNTLAANLGTEQMRQNGSLQRENMQQQGANARAVLSSGIDTQRVAIEQERANNESRAARQLETQRSIAIDPRATPEQRSAAERALMTLQGRQTADPYLVVPGGQGVFNRQTQQWVQQPGQLPVVRTPQDLDKLPKGAQFVGEDGVMRTKN